MKLSLLMFRAEMKLFEARALKIGHKNIKEIKDIVYAPDKGQLKLDAYFKQGAKKPALIYFHGGAFVTGGKKNRREVARYFAEKGVSVIVPNIGTAPEYDFKAQIKNGIKVIEHVLKNSSSYGADGNNVFIGGDSSGAYIAACASLAAINSSYAEKLGAAAPLPKGCVLFCGIFEPQKLLSANLPFRIERIAAAQAFSYDNKSVLSSHKDYPLVSVTANLNGSFIPAFLAYTDFDKYCPSQSGAFARRLYEFGGTVNVFRASEERLLHNWHLKIGDPFANSALDAAINFMQSVKNATAKSKYTEV